MQCSRLLLSPLLWHDCFCIQTVWETGCLLRSLRHCAFRINCLDEHKGASISYKSVYYFSCAAVIPEHYLTAPEGPSEERQLKASCCGIYSDSLGLVPNLFFRGFWRELRLGCGWEEKNSVSSSLPLCPLAGFGCLPSACPKIHKERRQRGHDLLPECPTSLLPLLPAE